MVDSDTDFIRKVSRVLHRSDQKFEVVATAACMNESLSLLETAEPDIILIDAVLGNTGREGIETVSAIKRRCLNPPKMIVVTDSDSAEIIIDSFLAGAVDYVYKRDYIQLPLRIQSALNVSRNPYETLARELSAKRKEIIISKLSTAEKEVISLMAKGLSYREISVQLNKEVQTVKNQAVKIFAKLAVKNRQEILEKLESPPSAEIL